MTDVWLWEPVHEHADGRGHIVYWRLNRDGRIVGAVSRQPGGWRALLYRYEPGRAQNVGRTELGTYDGWRAARRAVQRASVGYPTANQD